MTGILSAGTNKGAPLCLTCWPAISPGHRQFCLYGFLQYDWSSQNQNKEIWPKGAGATYALCTEIYTAAILQRDNITVKNTGNQIAFLCIQRLNCEENRPTRSSLKNQQQTAANPWTMAKAIGAPGVGTVDFDKGGKPEHLEKPSG